MKSLASSKPIAISYGPNHHFFGYYDKSPWSVSGQYILALQTPFMNRPPREKDYATIGYFDLHNNNRWCPLDQTTAWNWQQGAMLQWLPNENGDTIIYNKRDGDRFISVIRNLITGDFRCLPLPVYAISHDGKHALTANFSRLNSKRPGYGYSGLVDRWQNELHSCEDGIYWMDLNSGINKLIISLDQIAQFSPNSTMQNVPHWFNHLQFNADDKRFVFLHRWKRPDTGFWSTRMFTANPDGSDVFCLVDHEIISHFDWKNSNQIIAWTYQHNIGGNYILFTDQTKEMHIVGQNKLIEDGHCSFSPDRKWLLTDTYPDNEGKQTLILYNLNEDYQIKIGEYFTPKILTGEIRCDLHPRWKRDGKYICIDSAFDGTRQMYMLDVSKIIENDKVVA